MNKEQYLNTIASWKAYLRDGKHTKYKVYYDVWIPDINGYNSNAGKLVKDKAYDWKSDLTANHHLIYLIIRNKDISKAFKNNDTLDTLKSYVKSMAEHSISERSYAYDMMKLFMIPFGDNLTMDELRNIIMTRL